MEKSNGFHSVFVAGSTTLVRCFESETDSNSIHTPTQESKNHEDETKLLVEEQNDGEMYSAVGEQNKYVPFQEQNGKEM